MPPKRRRRNEENEVESVFERPSKTAIKRELAIVAELVRELIELKSDELDQLGIDPEVAQEIASAAKLKGGARRRQLKHLNAAVARLNVTDLRSQLKRLQQPRRDEVQRFHRYERWREGLLRGDAELIQQLKARFGDVVWSEIDAQVQQAQNDIPGASRALFRYLAALDESSIEN